MRKKTSVEIWVDGSVHPTNPGNGGWGAIIKLHGKKGTKTIRCSGLMPENTTNNQAETQAVIGAVGKLIKPCEITVYSDSRYFVLCFNKLSEGKMPRSNVSFWKDLAEVIEIGQHTVTVEKVKGHSGNPNNMAAHKLAYIAAAERKEVYEELL